MSEIDYVVHIASPYPLKNPKDEQELIKPAVEGTRNVMNAAIKNNVKKVVVTSSVCAMFEGHEKNTKKFSEQDWAEIEHPKAPINAYEKSKILAEKEAWAIYEQNNDKIALTVINPSFVVGPRR